MVVVQRNEVTLNRFLQLVAVVFSAIVIAGVYRGFSGRSLTMQWLSTLLAVLAAVAIVVAIIQLWGHPGRSQVILFTRDDGIVIATNALHEGYKLRFLRDIFGENVFSFSDEERARWKGLEADGYYASLNVRNVRKVIALRLCTMIFDDVFVADRNDRWEYYNSASTSEPTFSRSEMPRLKSWKMG